ncbi:MAG TPA: SRPBCC domain-containing protein, partial [Alphaproteobacteria bacterium]|nr:SRPBCC domain-containing protein [Alphaproteobacteria bacterium]
VLAWEPPHRLVLAWQISPRREPEPDPARASEVEVRFASEGPSVTRVAFEHRGFANHGADADGYRAGLDSAQGWTFILDRYAAALT